GKTRQDARVIVVARMIPVHAAPSTARTIYPSCKSADPVVADMIVGDDRIAEHHDAAILIFIRAAVSYRRAYIRHDARTRRAGAVGIGVAVDDEGALTHLNAMISITPNVARENLCLGACGDARSRATRTAIVA